jgi:hypothetical protein
MTYTKDLRMFAAELDRLRQAMVATDDDLLELHDRHERLSALDQDGQTQSDAELKARYGMEN